MPMIVSVTGADSILVWKILSPATFIIEKVAPAMNICVIRDRAYTGLCDWVLWRTKHDNTLWWYKTI